MIDRSRAGASPAYTPLRHGALLPGAGALAALAALGVSAHAADLPALKAAPVEYVRICDAHGTGFFYIPGSNTCLRIGGRVRAEYIYIGTKNAFVASPHTIGAGGATVPGAMTFFAGQGRDALGSDHRAHVRMDARTATAWGTVQTVIDMRMRSRSGVARNGFGNFIGGGAADAAVAAAYIRFAGFTFGRARQNWEFMPGAYGSKFRTGYGTGVNQLAYTAVFGQGLSATIALEDPRGHQYDNTGNLGGITGGAFQRGGVRAVTGPSRLPALVGNLRVQGGWGEFQIMGAVNQHTAFATAPNLLTPNAGAPVVKRTGYAIGSGLRINLPMIARGNALWIEAGYARGALGMIMEAYLSAPSSNAMLGGLQRRDASLTVFGVGGTAAAGPVALAGELTSAWQIAGLYRHFWTPTLRSDFHMSYASVTPGAQTRNTDWSKGGLSRANALAATAALIWSPTRGFTIGGEVGYMRISQRLTGDNGGAPSLLPAAAIVNGFRTNVQGWESRLRVQRDF